MKNKIKENCTFYEVLKETIENKAWCFRLPNWPKYTYANLSIQRPNIFLIHCLTEEGIKHKSWIPTKKELESDKYIVFYKIIGEVIADEYIKDSQLK